MKFIILALLISSCGSLQTINGINVRKIQKESPRPYVFFGVVAFGVGYYTGKNYLKSINK